METKNEMTKDARIKREELRLRRIYKKIDKDTLKMYNKKYDKENILQEYINTLTTP